ncbi:MAG: SCO family protein [Chitinophagales bacterium]
MEQKKKGVNGVAIALMVMVLPVLLFLIFHAYTRQTKDDLRQMVYPHKKFAEGVDTVWIGSEQIVDSVYHTIPPFSFQNQHGQVITNETLEGKIYVANFFFTSCPVMCPKLTEQMSIVQDEFIRDDLVVLVSHTVDPERDSIPKLKAYADNWGAVPGKWQFLTGEKEDLYETAIKGYFLSAADEQDTTSAAGHEFIHSDRFVLMDPDMNIRGFYKGTEPEDVKRMMGDMVLLLQEYKR